MAEKYSDSESLAREGVDYGLSDLDFDPVGDVEMIRQELDTESTEEVNHNIVATLEYNDSGSKHASATVYIKQHFDVGSDIVTEYNFEAEVGDEELAYFGWLEALEDEFHIVETRRDES